MRFHESEGWRTAALFTFLFLSIICVSNADYAWSLVDEASQKELRPLRISLDYARKDANRTRSVLLACLNGRQIALKDGYLWHMANCEDYKVREIFVGERP